MAEFVGGVDRDAADDADGDHEAQFVGEDTSTIHRRPKTSTREDSERYWLGKYRKFAQR